MTTEMTRKLRPYLYLLPCLALLGLFVYWPILYSAWLSLHKTNILSGKSTFVGLANYQHLLGGAEFRHSLWVTFLLMLISVPPRLLLALALAHLLRETSWFARMLRGVYFLPYVTSSVAISVIWSWMFNTDIGFVNGALGLLGLGRLPWFQDVNLAVIAVAIVSIWKQLGYDILLFIAGLNTIPEDYYEAARIDRAGRWRRFKDITFPLVAPTTLFLLIVSIIDSFQIFTIVDVMTEGGPANGTNVLMYYLYYLGFISFDVSTGSALAILLFLGLVAITLAKLAFAKDRVNYDLA
ncbi:sugar ABC transporter permease [Rhizobium sp. BK251]|uniref:carbohydrate ABC transporter permease n=1 Tax=Rhizobium sp. BK251 TaxID=2512125 RepID=UPI0010E41CB9|nr:sugar ABC transporter permease [Rhizobium sp. BK251]TCL73500.1 carbohydrate ABC transporter membrane protein 1 (CUT1 family) [Rhizobium sp. BK251]